jgi:glycosyltransferase involved in cell wall biosynthesis
VRAFLDVAPWDCRSRNTDWKYVRFSLPRLREWVPELDLVVQQSRSVTIKTNYKAIRMAIGKRVGFPVGLREWETDQLDAAELKRSGCNVVFSHRGYPTNAGDVPVIWQSSILDPVMTMSYTGFGEDELRPEKEIRHEFFGRAAKVQVSTEAEAIRLSRTFPELKGRFVPIPFFLPYLEAAPEQLLERHTSPETVEILFVGNDARRKGLDLLLAAFTSMPRSSRSRTHLTVVSNFDGLKVDMPDMDHITVYKRLPQPAVVELMRRAHVLVNVARFESYGFVFPEAMAQGTVCVGPAWEVQRELLDEGRAGVNLPCDADAIQTSLIRLVEDDDYRLALASAGWERFNKQYAPAIVAGMYAKLFGSVATRECNNKGIQ